jgi:hypothetical protein
MMVHVRNTSAQNTRILLMLIHFLGVYTVLDGKFTEVSEACAVSVFRIGIFGLGEFLCTFRLMF